MADRRSFLRHGLGAALLSSGIPWARAVADVRSSVLKSLLARNRSCHPGERGSNHTSMALLSLAALGAPESHIQRLGEAKLDHPTPFPHSGPAVSAAGWREQRGEGHALFGLRVLFQAEIARRGVAGTLRLYLPDLLPGLGAHAFHAIIRTGYGVRFGDPEEVAMGLAYWAVTYLPLGPLEQPGPNDDPVAALVAVRSQPLLTREGQQAAGIKKADGNIADKMAWAAKLPGFTAAASSLKVGPGSLAAIARGVQRLYLGTGDNFTALHAVTGTHAYRMIEPYVVDRIAGRRYLWQALVAAYVSIGAKPIVESGAAGPVPGWNDIVARGAASTDDHEIKLTDIVREEARHWAGPGGDEAYRRAAALHLGLV